MKTEKVLDFVFGEVEKLSEISASDLESIDLLRVREKISGAIFAPNKISWELTIDTDSLLEKLDPRRAKKMRKTLRQAEEKNIRVIFEEELTQENFLQWFEIYRSMVDAKEHGRHFIDETWFDARTKNGEKLFGLFFEHDGKIIGGLVGKKFFDERNYLSIAYRAYERIDGLELGLGGLVEFYVFEMAKKLSFPMITRGRDGNLYGYHLAPGLFHYKKSFGYHPIIPKANEIFLASTFILNFEKFRDLILLLGEIDGEFSQILIFKKDPPHLPDFKIPGLPQRVFSREEFSEKFKLRRD